jgi:hypothetical protein
VVPLKETRIEKFTIINLIELLIHFFLKITCGQDLPVFSVGFLDAELLLGHKLGSFLWHEAFDEGERVSFK